MQPELREHQVPLLEAQGQERVLALQEQRKRAEGQEQVPPAVPVAQAVQVAGEQVAPLQRLGHLFALGYQKQNHHCSFVDCCSRRS